MESDRDVDAEDVQQQEHGLERREAAHPLEVGLSRLSKPRWDWASLGQALPPCAPYGRR